MSNQTINKSMKMGEILTSFPSARRALFQKYHVGGCSSCGFEDSDTLEDVCRNHNLSQIDEVIDHLLKSHEVDQNIQISVQAVAEKLKSKNGLKIIDVRTDEEYAMAHIEGTDLVNNQESIERVMAWPKDTEIVVMCHHGMRSLDAASYLIGHGFSNVKSLTGGIDLWAQEIDVKVPRY